MGSGKENVMLEGIKAIIFDCDGVLWKGESIIPGSAETVTTLREKGFLIYFLTNNSTKSVCQYRKKFVSFKIKAEENEIITSARVASSFLKEKKVTTVHVVGEEGLVTEITANGMIVDSTRNNCQAVAVGMDRQLTYDKIALAAQNVINGALFIGTNPDPNFPSERGIIPGAGSCIAAVETAAERKVDYQLGKPNSVMFEPIARTGLKAKECLMVGDRIVTDILFAKNTGCKSLLVKTGLGKQEFERFPNIKPDYILQTVTDINQYL
ncbi:MAG: HAD-IIA family hydrolase [Candidatus Odinarchaeota archaeon]